MSIRNRRKWKRHSNEIYAKVKFGETTHSTILSDISAGGVSIKGQFNIDIGDDVDISLDHFGDFAGRVIRKWDDGYAVEFDLDNDDQHSLQENLASFMSEDDLVMV